MSVPADEELLEELLETSRHAFVPAPDTRIIEREGWWQMITPSFRNGGMNSVMRSVLDPSSADAVIAHTLADYEGLRFSWFVAPGSAPDDLPERLRRAGLSSHDTLALVRETSAPIAAGDTEIAVEEVTDENVDAFSDVFAEGWNVPRGPLHAFHLTLLHHPARQSRMFLARAEGVPAGAASLWRFERSVYLLGAVVLPGFRGKGLYRALTEARLRCARELGIPWATSLAMATTSAPLLLRLGFRSLARFPVFSNRT